MMRATHTDCGTVLRQPRQSKGVTLIELLVAMSIGLVLVLGSVTLYARSRATYQTAETLAAMQETLQFALDTLERDIRMAGFWGQHSNGAIITVTGKVAVRCDGKDVTAWALDLSNPISGGGGRYDISCAVFAAAQPGTDTLTLRRASSLPVTPRSGTIQLHSGRAIGQVFNDGSVPPGFPGNPSTHDIRVHAYYVDRRSSLGEVPSLRRQTLTHGGTIHNQEIIPGVEAFRVHFGVDADADGFIDSYVDPDDPTLLDDAKILSVRVWLMVRAEQLELGYRNTSAYAPAGQSLPIVPGDAFRRVAISRTVLIRNAAR